MSSAQQLVLSGRLSSGRTASARLYPPFSTEVGGIPEWSRSPNLGYFRRCETCLMSELSALSDEELAAIQARADAASDGPWRSMIEGCDHTSGDNFIMISHRASRSDDMYVLRDAQPVDVPDQDFIAHARQDIPRLLAEIARLQREAADPRP